MARSAAGVVKRIAAGRPLPSPKVKTDPRVLVTRRVPVRISPANAARSNRSIGRIPPATVVLATPATQLPLTGVGTHGSGCGPSRSAALPAARIKTKSLRDGNAVELPGAEAE